MNTGARNKAPGHTSLNGSVARSHTTPRGTSTASSLSAPSGGSSPSSPALSSRSSQLRPSCLSRSPSPRAGCTSSRPSTFRRSCPRARGVCATSTHSRFRSPFFCHCHPCAPFPVNITYYAPPFTYACPFPTHHMPSPAPYAFHFIALLYVLIYAPPELQL